MDQVIYLNPGDKVWYPHWPHLVVQATILECEDIYNNGDKLAIWHYRYDNGESQVSRPTDQLDEQGWHIYDHPDPVILQEHRRVNQLLWIDEPVGHSITLGDECFLTLQEALNTIIPSNKRHLRRRLKKSRGWGRFPDKKVYVKHDRSKRCVE